MMTKALKGTMAAAAGVALGLSGVAAAQAQDEEAGILAAGNVVIEDGGIQLYGEANGVGKQPHASMIALDLGDEDYRSVYCIQLEVDLEEQYLHEERPWEDVPVEDLPMVLGVLLVGYDGTNAGELLEEAGLASDDYGDVTQDQLAYAATQSAIWSLTDGWVIDPNDPTENDVADEIVPALQAYILEKAEPVDEPDLEPYFDVDDSQAKTEGTTVGPFTASTNVEAINFSQPEGATIVDENGEELTSLSDGTVFYVKFDEAKTSSVTLVTDTFTWTTPAGRTFVPVDAEGVDVEGQRLILAEEYTEEYNAEIEFEITVEEVPSESPKPQLPVTGSSLTTVAVTGGAVLLAGVVAMVLMRRRAARADWGSDT
ncbi:thioester domain-containing protein [Glycomyces niveus]|jgi:LPXTG-motif cell wall-anchored protein|uniref:Thioester domain-containing protein n=1 Tax=Glycomyces niveus TaxID=2820287 RepID=A0ABS3U5P7_9ACTN|nr:thioester domain-containing protein [Glycomyces sp. NEAU-S30]MBO3733781.1 thioester domain-containing protein [Glycomyces sp. NEAU-S30]